MDSHKHTRHEMPFYLCDPRKTRFVPTPAQPFTLTEKLNGIRDELWKDLSSDDLPERKKENTLTYFLGAKHDVDEMNRDMELSRRTLGSSNDDSTLAKNLEMMKTSYLSKRLEPLSKHQMKAFTLQPQPEGMSIFPTEVESEVNFMFEKRKHQDLGEQKKKTRKKPISLLDQDQTQTSSQESYQDGQVNTLVPTIPGSPESTQCHSGMAFQQASRSQPYAKTSQRSVANALKEVRRVGTATTGYRGKPAFRRGGMSGPTGRGRGRPRKDSAVAKIVPPIKIKLKPIPEPASSPISPSPPAIPTARPPSPSLPPSPPPSPAPQPSVSQLPSPETQVSPLEFCVTKTDGLKMTFNRQKMLLTSIPKSDHSSSDESSDSSSSSKTSSYVPTHSSQSTGSSIDDDEEIDSSEEEAPAQLVNKKF